jgi:hypothetical protein
VITGGLKASVTNEACQASYTGVSFSSNQYIAAVLSASQFGQITGTKYGLRIDSTGTAQGYYLVITGTAGTTCTIQITDISGNPIGPQVSQLVSPGDTFLFMCSGTSLLVYHNTILTIQTTDSQYTSGGSPTVYILDTTSHPFTKGVATFSAGNVTTGNKPASYTILGTFFGPAIGDGQGVPGPWLNPTYQDLLQVRMRGGNMAWTANAFGVGSSNPPLYTPTAVYGQYDGQTFATAFTNPQKLDILQIINAGGEVIWFVDYQGNCLFVAN